MAIRVDTDGVGSWDLELNDPTVVLPSIFDVSNDADTILDVDITAAGSSAVIDGVIFRAVTSTNAGTGIYNTFLAIGDNDGNEAGFNSDDTPPLDATNVDIDQAKTHTVLLAHVPITVIDGVEYYEVRIDINDANNVPNALISLDTFKIYTSADGSIVSTTQLFQQNLVYDIDANGNISILLSDAQSSGSGNDDYSILIPVSKFGGADPTTTYFYLFAEMGFAGGDYVAGSTFEEFNLQDAVVLTGTKFNDRDGDGVRDAGEEGVEGVTIFIDTDKDGVLDADERSTVTGANGSYTFYGVAAGTYQIDEVVPAGSTQTTGAFETITISSQQAGAHGTHEVDPIGNFNPVDISGRKFLDDEGDGLTVGDTGLGGVTIFIDIDGSGALNAGDLSTVTAADGTWSFSNLSSNVIGKTVYEVLPSGYTQTLGNAGYVITGDATNLDFANFELFDISGTKYDDLDGDGVIDAGEGGLGGVIVFIDIDDDGELSTGDLATITAADGTWSFLGLDHTFAGLTVYESLPDGYVQTLGTLGHTITGTSGADQTGLDFANFELFDIAGTKYTDTNGDGDVDAGETGLGGVTIFIDVDGSGTRNAGDLSTVTAADGTWSFTDLDASFAGKKVFEVLPTGYVQTLGTLGHTITGTSGADQTGLDFANFELFDLSGTKYDDLDGDGVIDAGEPGLAGVTIFIDMDGDGALDAGELSTTTDANGDWSFTDLGTGFAGKTVYEILPSGYVQTLGAAGYAITGTSGADQDNLDFANFDPNPVIDLEKFVITDQSGGEQDADDPDGPIASTSTTVSFHISLANTGNVALTNITLSDSVVHTVNGIAGAPVAIDYNDPAYGAWVDLDGDGTQDAGEDWATVDGDADGVLEGVTLEVGDTLNIYYSLTSELGQHENTASVTATAVLGGESAGDADDANYYVLPSEDCVGVGTPGFWSNNGAVFWDNIQDNETKAGNPGFADGELLYAVDSNNDGVVDGSDGVGLLVGDYNHNGLTDAGEDTLFISLATAKTLINASQKQQHDGKYMLGRDVVATWLNFLANGGSEGDTSCIDRPGTSDDASNPKHYLDDAIDWLQTFGGKTSDGTSESFDSMWLNTPPVKTSSANWQTAVNGGDHSASKLHSALDDYNNTGVIDGVEFCCDRDNADALFAIAQLSQTL